MSSRPFDIKIPEEWLQAVVKEMERVFNINGTAVKLYLQEHLQEQYDNLENKEGAVQLAIPEIDEFKNYIGKRERE